MENLGLKKQCIDCGTGLSKNPLAIHCRSCSNKNKPRGLALFKVGTVGIEHRKKISISRVGMRFSDKHRKSLSDSHFNSKVKKRGKESNFWRGGTMKERDRIMHSIEYKNWRKAVFERDDYTCQECGVRGVELQADHIKQFAFYPELRFELSNGRTLCVPCHKNTPTYLNSKKI